MLRFVSIVLIVVGAGGFLSMFAIGSGMVGRIPFELPNAEVGDVALSERGDAYIGSNALDRIQKYDADGKYLTGWPVDARGGLFCFSLRDGEIVVVAGRTNSIEIFDTDGVRTNVRDALPEDGHGSDCGLDAPVTGFSEKWEGIEISYRRADGTSATRVIGRQWWHYLALGPFYSWALLAIGILINPDWRRGIAAGLRKRAGR